MIKEVVECDNCHAQMPLNRNVIPVMPPRWIILSASITGDKHFCCASCVIAFLENHKFDAMFAKEATDEVNH